eukprot:c14911_g1_i3.p1 GENE.c14911_g1_i3~~c14911_g1_i3.p1  ORF type:complete len:312 (-),score=82.68 c14911_g1_i3:57-992(-)
MSEKYKEISKKLIFSSEQKNEFEENGFLILDNFFEEKLATSFRDEIKYLFENNMMTQNKVQFNTQNGPIQFDKPHIFEADMHDETISAELSDLSELFFIGCDQMTSTINSNQIKSTTLHSGPKACTVKLQYNSGNGGCFPYHYDNPGRPNKRKITLLCYLNPGWEEGDGGELVLIPFLQNLVSIPPLFNRVVIFQSDRILHRVLPATKDRLCFTIWMDGETNSDDEVFMKSKHLILDNSTILLLRSSGLQRAVSRAVYDKEYEKSLRECFKSGQGLEIMLRAHFQHLKTVSDNPPLLALVNWFKQFKNIDK